MKNKLLKNLSWLFFEKIIRISGGLFVTIWVARYLGPHDFGILNYSLAYTTLFMLFVKLGLDQIVIREIVKKPKLTKYLLGTAFGLKFIGSLVSILLILFSLYLVDTDAITRVVIILISLGFIFQSIDVIDYYYQSQLLSKYVVIAKTSAFIFSSLLKIYLIIFEFDVFYFAVTYIIDFALSGIILFIIYVNTKEEILNWRFSKKIAISLLKSSWPIALSSFLVVIYMKIDQVMIGNMLDSEQVGIYSIAVRLSDVYLIIPGIIISTFRPYFVRLREINNKLYHIRLTQIYSLMFWMSFCVGIVTILIGESFIRLLFGDVYVEAYGALIFNIWSIIAISQGMAIGIWLISEDLQKYRLYSNIIAVFLNVVLNLLLIPRYGISGAAIATFFTQSLSVWLFPFLWKPLRKSTFQLISSINPIHLITFRK